MIGKCQDQGEEAIEAWADWTREALRGLGCGPGRRDEGLGTTLIGTGLLSPLLPLLPWLGMLSSAQAHL